MSSDAHEEAVDNLVLSAEYQPIRCGQCNVELTPGTQEAMASVPISVKGHRKTFALAVHLSEECAVKFLGELKGAIATYGKTPALNEWLRQHHAV
jgi:hypothetical protein